MNIGVIGHTGNVGSVLVNRGCIPIKCNITDTKNIKEAITQARPDVVALLACKSDVDYCQDKANQEEIIKTNLRGAYNVFYECEKIGDIPVVFLSTDHVFNGNRGKYSEKEIPSGPRNYYGLTKM